MGLKMKIILGKRMHAFLMAIVICSYAPAILANELPEAPPFKPWLKQLMTDAKNRGIKPTVISNALKDVKPISRVIELDRRQPEFTLTFSAYFKKAISKHRILTGRAMLKKHAKLLKQISAKYGVQARFIVAFWGLETNYGQYTGSFPVIGALVTLAHDQRRARFFREQLLSALELIDLGHIPLGVTGSWAGAMGNHQFIPSTYKRYAIDFDNDGKRDLWKSLPDIFASAANYLNRSGWDGKRTWGREVRVPKTFDFGLSGLTIEKSVLDWSNFGLLRADGRRLPQVNLKASLLLPAGYKGPAFLVYKNYRTIMIWNRSILYALAIGHLADRIVGLKALTRIPPIDDLPLKLDDMKTIQVLLNKRGIDTGRPDGKVGPKTRAAIRAYQKSVGLPSDGYPSKGLIKHLRTNF